VLYKRPKAVFRHRISARFNIFYQNKGNKKKHLKDDGGYYNSKYHANLPKIRVKSAKISYINTIIHHDIRKYIPDSVFFQAYPKKISGKQGFSLPPLMPARDRRRGGPGGFRGRLCPEWWTKSGGVPPRCPG
jgi:hypothetical protein